MRNRENNLVTEEITRKGDFIPKNIIKAVASFPLRTIRLVREYPIPSVFIPSTVFNGGSTVILALDNDPLWTGLAAVATLISAGISIDSIKNRGGHSISANPERVRTYSRRIPVGSVYSRNRGEDLRRVRKLGDRKRHR